MGDAASGAVDAPVEELAVEPVEEPVGEPVDEVVEEPVGELVEEVVEEPVELPVDAELVITLVDSDSVPLVEPTGAAAPPPPPPQAASAARVARDAHVREKRLLMESYLS